MPRILLWPTSDSRYPIFKHIYFCGNIETWTILLLSWKWNQYMELLWFMSKRFTGQQYLGMLGLQQFPDCLWLDVSLLHGSCRYENLISKYPWKVVENDPFVYLGLLAQWYSIDMMTPNSQFSWKTFGTHLSAFIETCLSASITLLIHEPFGSLQLKSCAVEQLSDWYYSKKKNYKVCKLVKNEIVIILGTLFCTTLILTMRKFCIVPKKLSIHCIIGFIILFIPDSLIIFPFLHQGTA